MFALLEPGRVSSDWNNQGRALLRLFAIVTLLFASAGVRADIWNSSTDWSASQNPNGTWSYGRKWNAEGDGFDVFTARFANYVVGTHGWYLGGTVWQPSFIDGGYAWSNANSDGLPALRWTSPSDGLYSIDALFTGADSRGVSVFTFVVLDGSTLWNDRIDANLATAGTSFQSIYISAGQHVDFITAWTGVGDPANNWTKMNATIQTAVPEPESAVMLLAGLSMLGLACRRRSFRLT